MLHIFIVSLQQDVEKRETISKILNDFNLDFTFIDAVYGRELPNEYLDALRNKSFGKLVDRGFPATPGEIGCTLSHLKAYQQVIDRGLEWACILEDDAILDIRFKKFIDSFDHSKLDSATLYLLGGQNGLSQIEVVKSFKNIKMLGNERFVKTIRSEDFIYRTCCYLISLDLARSLVILHRNNLILADDWCYLIRLGLIKNIYLADFVDHPLDLSMSHLQTERRIASFKKPLENNLAKISLQLRAKKAIKWRLRLVILKAYRYIEKKEVL